MLAHASRNDAAAGTSREIARNAALECCATAAHRKVDVPVDQRPAGTCGEKNGSPLRSEVNGDVNLPVPTPPNRHPDTTCHSGDAESPRTSAASPGGAVGAPESSTIHHPAPMCHSGEGAPESSPCGNSQSQAQANAGSIQTQSASTPSGGITPKASIPGPCVLAHASRNDTQPGFSGQTGYPSLSRSLFASHSPPAHFPPDRRELRGRQAGGGWERALDGSGGGNRRSGKEKAGPLGSRLFELSGSGSGHDGGDVGVGVGGGLEPEGVDDHFRHVG